MPTFLADPQRRHARFNIAEIFDPNNPNSGPYVPNVNDIVHDTEARIEYYVSDVNYTTGVSTLAIWNSRKLTDPVGITDYFTSAGSGTIQDTFRLLVDTSKAPYVANLCSRLSVKGNNPSYVVFYLGEDATSEQAQPLSLYYTDTDNTPTHKIPLVVNKPTAGNNPQVKIPVKFYANQLVETNDIVTVVIYDYNDVALSAERLSVYDTKFVTKLNSAARYVTSIDIESPLVGQNPRVIEIPVNMDIASVQLFLRVRYNDGDSVLLPVDGNRAKLINLEDALINRVGYSSKHMLRYIPLPGEYVAAGLRNSDGSITDTYTITSIRGNGEVPTPDAYSFRLHAMPRFSLITRTWVMEYYLSSINRDDIYYVTSLVDYISGTYDGTKLGLMQRYVVSIDMSDVDPSFNAYIHTQEIVVTLMGTNTQSYPPLWYTRDYTSQPNPYGENILVRGTKDIDGISGRWGLYIGVQADTLEEWLNRTYYSTNPLYDPRREGVPLYPTHVRIKVGADILLAEIPATYASVTSPVVVEDFNYDRGELIVLEFIRRTVDGDLYLSAAGMSLVINA